MSFRIQETDYRPHFTCGGILCFLKHYKHTARCVNTVRMSANSVRALPQYQQTLHTCSSIVTAALQRQYSQTELIFWITLVLGGCLGATGVTRRSNLCYVIWSLFVVFMVWMEMTLSRSECSLIRSRQIGSNEMQLRAWLCYGFKTAKYFMQYIVHSVEQKNPSAWYFVRPAQAVTWRTVAIITESFYFPHICAFVAFLCLPFITIKHTACILTEDSNTFA